jgi:DNA-directed RNA polymerase specialized sigma24 family protein
MNRFPVILKTILALTLVWVGVWGVRSWAGSRKITAEKVNQEIDAANFEDWSGGKGQSDDPGEREREIRRIAEMINRLDFHEREKNRQNRTGEEFFRKLSKEERTLFVDLTVMESMNRFMEALDGLEPSERRRFVQQALQEIDDGRTAEEMERAKELGDDLLDRISEEGMQAYFNKASADTKLDLAPLMEAMNEVMQGMRGNDFGGLGGKR